MSSIDLASTQPVNDSPVVPLQASPELSSTPGDGDQYNSSLFPSAPSQPQVQPVQQPRREQIRKVLRAQGEQRVRTVGHELGFSVHLRLPSVMPERQ